MINYCNANTQKSGHSQTVHNITQNLNETGKQKWSVCVSYSSEDIRIRPVIVCHDGLVLEWKESG